MSILFLKIVLCSGWLKLSTGFYFVMLHVRALSGAPVAELHVEELRARHQQSERSLVVTLKRFLGAQLGCSRFRLKLLGEDSKEIDDDAPLTGPADMSLVRMDFQLSDVATNAAFVSACARGRVTEVERLLNAFQNPDARDAENFMGIHWAAYYGHPAIVQLLLEAGTDKDAARPDGTTALHVAGWKGHLDVVRLLLEGNADKDALAQDGRTALHIAAEYGRLNVVELLLTAGADKDAAKPDGATALHLASENGCLDVVRYLLQAGAERDVAKKDGATALRLATMSGHLDVCEVLQEAGAAGSA